MITLVLGGRRSGKSLWAEKAALKRATEVASLPILYLATAQDFDGKMSDRIELHRQRRGSSWASCEEPIDILPRLKKAKEKVVLLDCLSMWVSNLMLAEKSDSEIISSTEQLAFSLKELSSDIFIVSSEVGFGVAPSTELGNRFCDLCGLANQKIAEAAEQVIFVVAGQPLVLK